MSLKKTLLMLLSSLLGTSAILMHSCLNRPNLSLSSFRNRDGLEGWGGSHENRDLEGSEEGKKAGAMYSVTAWRRRRRHYQRPRPTMGLVGGTYDGLSFKLHKCHLLLFTSS